MSTFQSADCFFEVKTSVLIKNGGAGGVGSLSEGSFLVVVSIPVLADAAGDFAFASSLGFRSEKEIKKDYSVKVFTAFRVQPAIAVRHGWLERLLITIQAEDQRKLHPTFKSEYPTIPPDYFYFVNLGSEHYERVYLYLKSTSFSVANPLNIDSCPYRVFDVTVKHLKAATDPIETFAQSEIFGNP